MPVHGDRVHNSLDQESLTHGQHQFKAADKNWQAQGLANNSWVGNQTSNGLSLVSNLKNYSPQQSDMGPGHGITSFHGMQGLNPVHPNLRSDFSGNQFQNQQINLNGYLQETHVSRQHEANFLGIGPDSNQQISSNGFLQGSHISKGLSMLESQRGNGTEFQKNNIRFQNGQPPTGFNSYVGQGQVENQHPGLQSLQRQQSGVSDMQLMQQQMMLKQFQDAQRQQLLGQGAWQQSSPGNFFTPMTNQAADNHSTTLLNGIPVHDSSNKSWSELMAGNLNRQHLGPPGNVQGSSGGMNLPLEQSQELRFPQQVDQSLYGVPISGSRGNPDPALHVRNENPAMQHMSSFGNSFMAGQYAAQSGQETIHDGPSAPRQVGASGSHSSSGGFDLNSLRQVVSPQRNMPAHESHGRQDLGSLLDNSQQKPSPAVAQSQKVATLDPAEEKILFGSDGNLWDAFGGETSTGGFGMSDGAGSGVGFSSLQSGSWSALMQSALAETTSGETGQQEELCGLSNRNSEPQVRNQQSSIVADNEKQRSTWSESVFNNASNYSSGRDSQLGGIHSHERTENLQVGPSNRNQNSSEEKRWLDPTLVQKPLADGDRNQFMSGSWINQQSMSSQGISDKLNDSTNGWRTSNSTLAREAKSHTAENLLQSVESQKVGRVDSSYPNSAVTPTPSISMAATGSGHPFRNNQSSDFWRQVGGSSAVPSGSEGWRNNPLSMDRGSQGMESSENNEKDNFEKKESSAGSFHSISRHGQSGASRENVLSDDNHSRNMFGSNQNQSDRAVQRPFVGRKFQYHPMGDVDGDMGSSYGAKSVFPSQAATQHFSNKFTSTERSTGGMPSNRNTQSSQNMLELLNKLDQGKERESGSHFSSSDRNDTNEAETSEGSVGHFQRNQSPRSQGIGLQLAPPSQRLQSLDSAVLSQSSPQISRSPQISSDRGESGHPSFFPSSLNRSSPSLKETFEGENRNYGSGAAGHISDKQYPSNFPGNSSMASFSGFPFARNNFVNQRDAVASGRAAVGQSVNVSLNRLASSSMLMEASSGVSSPSQSAAVTIPDASKDNCDSIQTHPGNLFQQSFVSEIIQGSRTSPNLGMSQQPSASQRMSPNLWRPVTDQQGFFRPHVQPNSTDTTSTKMRKAEESDRQKGEDGPNELNASLAKLQAVREEQRVRVGFWQQESSNAGAAQSTSQMKDSVNHVSVPTSMSHQEYSLLNQMQVIRRVEVDTNEVTVKRFENSEGGLDSQQIALEGNHVSSAFSTPRGDWMNASSAPLIGDSKMFNFPVKPADKEMSAVSPDMDALQQDNSHNSISSNDPISMRRENLLISPPMRSSWFDQHGTLMNGQIAQSFEGCKMAAQAPSPEKPADSSQVPDELDKIPAVSDVGMLSDALPAEVNQKKRKISIAEVQPWNKEVTKSAKLHSASLTEIEWARAANRLVQKVPEVTETSEDVHPIVRTKRRLILTTQLMQQLLRPPPAPFLSGEAKLHYNNVVYCVGKLALGDACSAAHHFSGEGLVPNNNSEKASLPEKPKLEGKEDFARAMEDFSRRTKKLESEFLSLEQRPSMVDVKVECQDLERFCIINRFAKFHGRAQIEGTGGAPPSSSDHTQKPFPQRYVLALPMPRNLPETVQCLSLSNA